MNEPDAAAHTLDQLAYEYTERLRRGETPKLKEYIDQYPQLASQIEELFPTLQMVEQLGPLESSVARRIGSEATLAELPRQFGEYRVLREVGRGGMGVVYEAVQESLGRHVAVKVLSAPLSARSSQRERFEREARAAAHLHHTNIVPVFAVGQADGAHYYAMQFIQGQSLDRVLEQVKRLRTVVSGEITNESLPIGSPNEIDRSASDSSLPGAMQLARSGRTRYQYVAQIGLQAADALASAHEQGVLHRDIKPSNLLLDTHDTLWITDFGLARIAGLPELTVAGDVVGTLRYVPPERFQGQTDARGDIYSLGLTLYELLSLRPAFDAGERAQLVNSILHTPVASPRNLEPQIPRDLETIVLRASERDPDRRYPTAAALADDLRRFLADQPIRARRISPWERTWRWCRRNPHLATLATAVTVMSIAALAILTVSNARIRREQGATSTALAQATVNLQAADENYRLAKQAVDEYLSQVTSSQELESRDELHELRRKLLEKAISFYDKLSHQKGDDERAVADRLAAYLRLGSLHRDLGDLNAAFTEYQQARTLLMSVSPTMSRTAAHRSAVADVHINLGAILADMGHAQESLHEMDAAIAIVDQLATELPDDKQYRLTQSKLQYNRCVLFTQLGQLDQALEACQASVRLQSAIVRDSAGEDYYAWMLSHSYNRQGMLLSDLGRSEQATAAFAQAIEIQQRLVAATPDLVEPRDALSMTLANQANQWLQQGNAADAIQALQQSVRIQQEICDEYPSVVRYRMSLAHQQISLAAALRATAQYPASLELLRNVTQSLETLVTGSDVAPDMVERLADAYGEQAALLEAMGNLEDSHVALEKAIGLLNELVAKHAQRVEYTLGRSTLLNRAGFFRLRQGDVQAAIACFDQVVNDAATLLAIQPQQDAVRDIIGQAHMGRAKGLVQLGRNAESLPEWDRACELRVGLGRIECRVARAMAMTRAGAVDEGMNEVELLSDDPLLPGAEAHHLGCISAFAGTTTTDAARRDRYASRAIDLFRRAAQRGYLDLEYLRASKELDELRSHAEFQQLLVELETVAAEAPD